MSVVESLLLDTNVLIYAHDRNESVKGPQARALLSRIFAAGQPLLSTQIFSEFYWTTTRKIRFPLTPDESLAEIKRLAALTRIAPITWTTLTKAFDVLQKHGLALWDAQIIAVGLLNGSRFVLSEDMQHRQSIDGITVINPFASDFDEGEILIP